MVAAMNTAVCELATNRSRKSYSASLLSHGEEKKEKLAKIKSGLDEADVLIRIMDLEVRSSQPSAKAVCLLKLREYKTDLNQLKKDFKRVSSSDANKSTRVELMEPDMSDVHADVDDDIDKRKRVLTNDHYVKKNEEESMDRWFGDRGSS
ncbi:hypothetical protein Bca4012_011132 [Brassica carinata]